MNRVPLNPALLRWARERAGLSREDLAGRFRKLSEWEAGEVQPTLKQVEAFARAVRVPVGYLFLSAPPEESIPIPDFRTRARQALTKPSPDLLEMIYACQERQSWYREYARVTQQPEIRFVNSATLETPVGTVAVLDAGRAELSGCGSQAMFDLDRRFTAVHTAGRQCRRTCDGEWGCDE